MGTADDATIPGDVASRPIEARPLARGAMLGRYVVLAELGRGGMGVVLAAYDPELDRKVAVKLVRASGSDDGSAGRLRLLREAQALAKLSHPNVVAVHDVGTVDDEVWIAMEFVDGVTLAAWIRESSRSWRDVLDVMVPALRGLVAAHAAGITHRDFKPGNVMLGRDGRVRVLDFGLARADATATDDETGGAPLGWALASPMTQHGRWLGTPTYMAPEQMRGDTVDQRSDQFAFCVSLWELLYGERPFEGHDTMQIASAVIDGRRRPVPRGRNVPQWLRSVCERGLLAAREQRFPTSSALLEALLRGQSRMRRRRIALGVGAVVIAALAWGALARRQAELRREACRDAAAAIDAVWNEDAGRRARAAASLGTTPDVVDSVDKVMPWLDAHALAWREAAESSCLVDTEPPGRAPAIRERSAWCLEDRRIELAAFVAELERGHPDFLRHAVVGATRLADPNACVDESVLAKLPDPPPVELRPAIADVRAELARARTLSLASRSAEARAAIVDIRARAEAMGERTLLASVLRSEATILREIGEYPEAERVGIEAYDIAVRVGAWEEAALAAEGLMFDIGHHQHRPAEGRSWALHAELAAVHGGDPIQQHEVNRLNNLGAIDLDEHAFDAAAQRFEQALALQEARLGADHPLLVSRLNNLAIAHHDAGRREEALALFRRAVDLRERTLGPMHPELATSLDNLGVITGLSGDVPAAVALHERALEIEESVLGPDSLEAASTLANIAAALQNGPERARARDLHERALAIRERVLGPEHPMVARSLTNLGLLELRDGDTVRARDYLERALAIRERALGPDHATVAAALVNAAQVDRATGNHPRALERLERAVAIFDAGEGLQPHESEARFDLAKILLTADRARALVRARSAREAKVAEGAAAHEVAEIDTWIAANERAAD